MKTIKASEANRGFSRVLRDIARGERYTIVSRGRPVALIEPWVTDSGRRKRARTTLLNRLRRQQAAGDRHWTRSELYD